MQIGIMANMIGMALVYEMLEFSGNRFFFTCVWERVYPERWHILSVLSTSGAALGSAKRRMRRARIEAHSNHNQTKSRRRIAKSFSVFRIYYLGTHAPLCVCSVSPLSLSLSLPSRSGAGLCLRVRCVVGNQICGFCIILSCFDSLICRVYCVKGH